MLEQLMSYFRAWPFRTVPEATPELWADRKAVLQNLEAFASDVCDRDASVFGIVWGEFGAGKSHSLLHLRRKIRAETNGIVVYSPLPKQMSQFSDLYRQGFVSAMSFYEIAKSAAALWKRLNPSGIDERLEMDSVQETCKIISDGWTDFAQVIHTLGRIIALTGSLKDPLCLAAEAWLYGRRLTNRELRFLGASSNLTYDTDFVRATTSLIRLFMHQSTDSRPFFWFLDDCHFMAGLKPGQKRLSIIQQGIRDVFDGCPSKLGLVMAFASKESSHLSELLIGDILSRSSYRIEIPVLNEEDALEFALGILGASSVIKGKGSSQSYPFTSEGLRESVDLLSRKTDLTPRELMKCLGRLVSEAQLKIFPGEIDQRFVADFMKTYNPKEHPIE